LATEEDAAFFLELLNDSQWLQFIGDPEVRDEKQAKAWIRNKLLSHYQELGCGFYVVTLRHSEEAIGISGVVRRPGLEHMDLGFGFLPAYRAQGMAKEAAIACMEHARQDLGCEILLAITQEDNRDSIGLLQTLGFHLDGKVVLPGTEQELLRYLVVL